MLIQSIAGGMAFQAAFGVGVFDLDNTVVCLVDINDTLTAYALDTLAKVFVRGAVDEYTVLLGILDYTMPNFFLFSSRAFLVISKLFSG